MIWGREKRAQRPGRLRLPLAAHYRRDWVKYHRAKLTSEPEHLYILPIGDIHLGHSKCDYKMLQGYLQWADEHRENTRIILMGDLLECATKTSVGKGIYEESFCTNEQIKRMKEILRPYADIIDGAVIGNHEMRISKDTSIDVMEQICDALRIPYLGYSGVIGYSANKVAYSVFAWHGAGGGRKPGGSLNRLEDMAGVVQADVYLMGHTHRITSYTREIKVPDTRNAKITNARQVFVNTGSCLEWDDGYPEMQGLTIPKRGFPRIRMNMAKGKKDVHVSL